MGSCDCSMCCILHVFICKTQIQAKTGGTQLFHVGTVLLTSDFGSSTRGERHNSYNANHPQRVAYLVTFKISIHLRRSGPEKLKRHRNGRKLNSLLQWQELSCLAPWSNLNSQLTIFQNPQILRTISFGHDVIHTSASFPVRKKITIVIIRQWWVFFSVRQDSAHMLPNPSFPVSKYPLQHNVLASYQTPKILNCILGGPSQPGLATKQYFK